MTKFIHIKAGPESQRNQKFSEEWVEQGKLRGVDIEGSVASGIETRINSSNSRAYKNLKYNDSGYYNYGINAKYFGVQASRFPGSIKEQYCDIDHDELADATYIKRRSPAVGKNYGCVKARPKIDNPLLHFTIDPDSFITPGLAIYQGHYVYDPNSKLKNYITQYSGPPTVIDLSNYSAQYQTFKGASLNNYGRFTKAYNIDCTEYEGAEVTVYRQVSWSQKLFTWHFTVDGSPGLDITATTPVGTAALNILNLNVSISGQTGNDPWIEPYDEQSCG